MVYPTNVSLFKGHICIEPVEGLAKRRAFTLEGKDDAIKGL